MISQIDALDHAWVGRRGCRGAQSSSIQHPYARRRAVSRGEGLTQRDKSPIEEVRTGQK